MAFDLHMLDVRPQSAPHCVHQGQRPGVGFGHRGQNNLVPLKQNRIGGFDTTLLGSGNRVPGNKAWRHAAKGLGRSTHDIALGAPHISQNGRPQIHARQQPEHFLHGQNRHCQLDDISTTAGDCQISFAAINHTQFYSQGARRRVQIDSDHLSAQPALAHAFSKGATNQAEPDNHQPTHNRLYRFQGHYINHKQEPWPAPQADGYFPPADQ